MAIIKKPQRNLDETAKPDPMTFIQGADHAQPTPEAKPETGSETKETKPQRAKPPKRERTPKQVLEPILIRFETDLVNRLDREAQRRGLSRAALVRMLVLENLPE
jgi:hypothetical protein